MTQTGSVQHSCSGRHVVLCQESHPPLSGPSFPTLQDASGGMTFAAVALAGRGQRGIREASGNIPGSGCYSCGTLGLLGGGVKPYLLPHIQIH